MNLVALTLSRAAV